jgi:hypothetical protein
MGRDDERLLKAVLGLNSRIMGAVVGAIGGVGLCVATLVLVLRGGENVGTHLSLLNQFFPGYSVTYVGSVIGLFYGLAAGYVAGWCIAWLYNRFVYLRGR